VEGRGRNTPANLVTPGERCSAATDPLYLAVNGTLWLIGASGMFWLTDSVWLNLIMPVAYIVVCYVYFNCIYAWLGCANCVYKHPELDVEDYLSRYTKRFQRSFSLYLGLWAVLAWGWPVTAMIVMYFTVGRIIILATLLTFLIVSSVAFFPTLLLRVCPRCRVRALGICPFHLYRVDITSPLAARDA
jgi:hypothetical protein